MKKTALIFLSFILLACYFFSVSPAEAKTRVKRYYKPKSGTYVQPHFRTSPNKSKLDNWSSKGNYNPYNGKKGTKDPFKPTFKWRY